MRLRLLSRNWWDQEDGLPGVEYYDDGYSLDGYDRYQRGQGWYDRDGRYVYDERYRGEDRWSRGGGFRDGRRGLARGPTAPDQS